MKKTLVIKELSGLDKALSGSRMNFYRQKAIKELVKELEKYPDEGLSLQDVQKFEKRIKCPKGEMNTALSFLQVQGFVKTVNNGKLEDMKHRYFLLENKE